MTVLSKLAYHWGFPIVTANCHEITHTWEPDCLKAIWVAVPGGFWFCLKTYTIFYALTTLINKRGKLKEIKYQKLLKFSEFSLKGIMDEFQGYSPIKHVPVHEYDILPILSV